ncbi:MAG: SLC13 family permease [Nitriliruptoraceae bacterium]
MTVEIAVVFGLIVAALVLFASQRMPLDVAALLVLVVVITTPFAVRGPWFDRRGIDFAAAFPSVGEGLSGLSNPATVTVLAMFILSAGVQRTGLVHVVGQKLFTTVKKSEVRQLLAIALVVGPISGLVNNTAAVAVAIPLVLDMARRTGTNPTRLLLPVSFFGMMGGTLTLVGTSTNVLASAIVADDAMFGRPIGMFEFSHVGAVVLAIGLVYFATVGRWLIPERAVSMAAAPGMEDALAGRRDDYLIELSIRDGSELVGTTLEETQFADRFDVTVLRVEHGARALVKNATTTVLDAGDIVQVRAGVRQVMDLVDTDDVDVLSEFGSSHQVRGDGAIARVLLRNPAVFAGTTASDVDFWQRYRARPIGLERDGRPAGRIASAQLNVGDVVLLDVSHTALSRLRRNFDVIVLDEYEDTFDRTRMWTAAGIVAAVVVAAAVTPMPIVLTALIGVVAMAAAGCVNKGDLYGGVAWDVIILLAGVIPLGIAMTKSGGADWLALHFAGIAGDWHPLVVMIALYAVTTLLTELVSNNASVVILIPVALSLAVTLAMPPLALVLVVMFAASTSFLSPVGYQTNTMVYGTGLYRFTDFARVGAPLNLLLMVATSVAIYRWWVVV